MVRSAGERKRCNKASSNRRASAAQMRGWKGWQGVQSSARSLFASFEGFPYEDARQHFKLPILICFCGVMFAGKHRALRRQRRLPPTERRENFSERLAFVGIVTRVAFRPLTARRNLLIISEDSFNNWYKRNVHKFIEKYLRNSELIRRPNFYDTVERYINCKVFPSKVSFEVIIKNILFSTLNINHQIPQLNNLTLALNRRCCNFQYYSLLL